MWLQAEVSRLSAEFRGAKDDLGAVQRAEKDLAAELVVARATADRRYQEMAGIIYIYIYICNHLQIYTNMYNAGGRSQGIASNMYIYKYKCKCIYMHIQIYTNIYALDRHSHEMAGHMYRYE